MITTTDLARRLADDPRFRSMEPGYFDKVAQIYGRDFTGIAWIQACLKVDQDKAAAEPTTWFVAVTTAGATERTQYRNGKDAHRVASRASMEPGTDHASVTFGRCVTTYRNGIGTGPDAPALLAAASEREAS